MSCPLCLQTGSDNNSGPEDLASSPLKLSNLIPIGSLCLSVNVSTHKLCDHRHRQDGWHAFLGNGLLELLEDPEDDQLCRQLTFLIENHFLAATSHLSSQLTLATRIYLIPYDLPQVLGKFRNRPAIVLGPARRFLRDLLERITFDAKHWDASIICPDALLPSQLTTDDRTLVEIYGDLPSPRPSLVADLGSVQSRLLDFDSGLEDIGLRTRLHRYQRETVAHLLQREQMQAPRLDSLYLPLKAIDGKQFYFQPGTCEVLRDCPLVAPVRGGILCEELGTGKTLMILTLILASLNEISLPEESFVDIRPIMTPMSFRYFPGDPYKLARHRLRIRLDKEMNVEMSKCPSLVELLLHKLRTAPCGSSDVVGEVLEPLNLQTLYKASVPFYHHYLGEPTTVKRSRRKAEAPAPRVIYLTRASLVVVPANLIGQWVQEIHKHCAFPLQVLVLRSADELPMIKSLATDYDIILMTYERFIAEDRNKDISKLHSFQYCSCPLFPSASARVPDCSCTDLNVSPLLQIRWKRLVIDEGHNSATTSTILTPLAKLLSVESKWIVTGTPTTNLLGLSFGQRASEEIYGQPDDPEDGEIIGEVWPTEDSLDELPSCQGSRLWTKSDRQDLNKLSVMMTHFLSMPQFLGNPELFKMAVVDALVDRRGARPGAIQVLMQFLGSVMIRHRIEDVEKDVALPAITKNNVLLDLEPLAARSYNVLQALIAINAIDSERTGQDYMFHTGNSEMLQRTVANMSQIMVWSVDPEKHYNVDENMEQAEKYLEHARDRNVSAEDMELLQTALLHIREASEDRMWRFLQASEECPYKVFNLDQEIIDAWTRRPPQGPASTDYIGCMHPDLLRKLRDTVMTHPLASIKRLTLAGEIIQQEERERIAVSKSNSPSATGKSRDRKNHITGSVASATPSQNKLRRMNVDQASTLVASDYQNTEYQNTEVVKRILRPLTTNEISDSVKHLHDSPLGITRIGSSASSKLNFIIKEVMEYSQKEKILVFSQSPLTLAHVADALELVQIKFLQFTTQINPRIREQLVVTFETSETHRVFLMELKHGARGLNLTSASRVIFCEPVWQADVESQAIKRVHRIGQTKPVTVKTLAIRNTAEEYILKRRNMMKESLDKFPKLIEEAGMRYFIANPKFITSDPRFLPTIDFPLLPLTQPQTHSSTSTVSSQPAQVGPSTKKRKTVVFVDIE